LHSIAYVLACVSGLRLVASLTAHWRRRIRGGWTLAGHATGVSFCI